MSPLEEKTDILQLGKGGMDDPSRRAAAPPEPPLLFRFLFLTNLTKFESVSELSPEALVATM